ncbi:TetR/AcrR family transcriptional regulator [Cohnella caldifontis]|uniref:TetR/AcrR family transcriptional regulator n=1 Tax=Cohnella caldifontis TaxID=3027471 RepID=UPI0023EA7F66|nr:TetR/AcrR family transcriptional regulator [Cohnella sp. YIM B05605]
MSEAMEPWLAELMGAGSSGERMTEKQKRIFEAAVEVFAEKGYSAASTSEIAQRAGVAEGTIFRHYRTKKELLIAIVAPAMVRMLAPFVLREFRDVFKTDYETIDQFLRAMIENRIEFLEKNKSFLRILLQELPFHPELQEQLRSVVFPQVKERIEKVIDRFREKGQLIELPSVTIIRLVASAAIGYVLMRTFFGSSGNPEWNDTRERQATIDFIRKGLTP